MSNDSRVAYRATEGQQEFDFPHPFISRTHVAVKINGTISEHTWVSDSRIRLPRPCQLNDVVTLTRATPIDGPVVEFQNGSVLTEEELNTALAQVLYRLQEQNDFISGALEDGLVRLGERLDLETTPGQVIDEMTLRVLEQQLLDEFRQRFSDIDYNAETTLGHSLKLNAHQALIDSQWAAQANAASVVSGLRGDFDTLVGVVDGLANLETGGIATVIQNESNARILGDEVLTSSLALLGSVNGPRTAFNLNLNTTMANATTSMAQRLNAISAQADANSRTIFAEQIIATSNAISAQGSILTGLSTNVAGVRADLISESNLRSNAIAAVAGTLALLGANSVSGNSFILDQNKVLVSPTETMATRFSTMSANSANLAALINNESTVRTANGAALAGQIAAVSAQVAGANATVFTLTNTFASANAVQASQISGLSASISGANATITNLSSIVSGPNGLTSQWGVQLNNNGHISGINLLANAATSKLTFVADETAFVSAAGGTPVKIMSVAAGKVVFNSNVAIDGDLLVSGSINGGKLIDNAVTGIEAAYNNATVVLNGTTPTRVHGLWLNVQKATSPIDIDFNCWGTFTHNAGGSFITYVELVRASATSAPVVLCKVPIYGSGMANDTWQGPIPVRFLDTPGATGLWHYYVQIYMNVSNMTVQSVTARYGKLTEMKNNIAALSTGTGSGPGAGSGGSGTGGGGDLGGGGGGGITDPEPGGGGGGVEDPTMPTVPQA